MKKSLIFLVLVVLTAALIAGCAGQKAESVLDKIKTSGKVVVGTSADYAPYEFVDDAGKITGFDVELMEEIAKRMGVELVWTDMPFDSLIAAVQEGKIDMSISCFNYSEERDAQVDFSDAYYTSEDAFLVTEAFTGTITDPLQVAQYKIGVQSGTVQDDWVTTELIDAGLMPESNLSRYERVDQAALDLQSGRIDVLVADSVPAKAIIQQTGSLKIIYEGMLYTGPINIVLPEGDTALREEINKIIKELQGEGFIDALAVKYFSE
ncbi:MAG TPA: ABC transporter substrate-binding protein [Anaerolineaceae bacterium]|jgi:polar amino acid transport system substrate-binding protein|nr:amino acid ABC transporter substrate-binding protein [Anaerolineaceae bacterium]HOE34142.1 ABC transporter substrate-binding protein [Anaerolineaceae bacterium]HOT25139.1 ABC transporter substrate-binding protein [Anaerolineaceae bacterium]HQH57929.1 ABC transporter substrate-binding protein [Anaerolineaceae bacterium]HQK02800.1 ABC transporter substrate-binding protein [Anaerolineaceae bacterium]